MSAQIKNKDDYFNTDHLKVGLKGKAMRGAGITLFASGSSFFVHIFSTVVLARLLTPEDFGLIAMVTAFSLLLQNFGVNGFSEAIIQKNDLNHRTMSALFWINAAIMSGLSVIFALMAPVLVWFYSEPLLLPITIGISISIFSAGMTTLPMAILRRNMNFYRTAGISMFAMIFSLCATIIMAWRGFGYWSLIANTVLQPLTTAILGWLMCRWRPGKPGSIKDIKPMFIFAMHTYANFAMNYYSRNIDKLLVGWRYGSESLGYYKKAFDLFALPANQLIAPIHNVALSALSRLNGDPEKFTHYYLSTISLIAFIGMPISAILMLTGHDIILLILGPQWIKAAEIFIYFGASIGIVLIRNTQGWLHLSLGRPDRWLRWSILQTIINTCFFLVGLQFGMAGVAIAYSIEIYILALPSLWYAGKIINLSITSLLSSVWRYFVAALLAGLLSFAILYKLDYAATIFTNLNVFIRIVAASTLCLALYLIFIILLYQSLNPIKNFLSTAYQMRPKRIQK